MPFPDPSPTVGVKWSAGGKLRVAEGPWRRTVVPQEELAENVSQQLRRMDRGRLTKVVPEELRDVLRSIEEGE